METEEIQGRVEKTNEEVAYAAGFFDADGTVAISRSHLKSRQFEIAHSMRVAIGQVNYEILCFFKARWGGSIYHNETRDFHTWQANSWVAHDFLCDIFPFLVLKRCQAEIAIAFQKRRKSRYGGCAPLSYSEFEADEVDYWKLREFKRLQYVKQDDVSNLVVAEKSSIQQLDLL